MASEFYYHIDATGGASSNGPTWEAGTIVSDAADVYPDAGIECEADILTDAQLRDIHRKGGA